MKNGLSMIQRVRFYFQVCSLYIITVALTLLILRPAPPLASAQSVLKPRAVSTSPVINHLPPLVSGKPIRIVIPASGIDLPVEEGHYSPVDNSWTLSGLKAHFAAMSSPANNRGGVTFIYGHNNNDVFGALRRVTPSPGAIAQVYTDNGRIFEYAFEMSASVTPTDTSALQYQGPPILTVLTCTGSLSEWRTLYKFNLVRVVQ